MDEVVEYETREVEGKQKVEWIPHVVDEWSEERDLGVRDRHIVERGQAAFSRWEGLQTQGWYWHPFPPNS